MGSNKMLVINNGVPNTIIGVFVILAVVIILYTIGYAILSDYKEQKLNELKNVAEEGIEKKKLIDARNRRKNP